MPKILTPQRALEAIEALASNEALRTRKGAKIILVDGPTLEELCKRKKIGEKRVRVFRTISEFNELHQKGDSYHFIQANNQDFYLIDTHQSNNTDEIMELLYWAQTCFFPHRHQTGAMMAFYGDHFKSSCHNQFGNVLKLSAILYNFENDRSAKEILG